MGSNDTPKRERAYAEVSGTLQHDFSHSFVLSKGPSFLPQKQQLLLLVKVLHFIAQSATDDLHQARDKSCLLCLFGFRKIRVLAETINLFKVSARKLKKL